MPEPLQRLHVSGLVPGGTPLPPANSREVIYFIKELGTGSKKTTIQELNRFGLPQVSHGTAALNATVFEHPWTASIKDISKATYQNKNQQYYVCWLRMKPNAYNQIELAP